MKIKVKVAAAQLLVDRLDELDARFTSAPSRDTMLQIGEAWAERFRENVRDGLPTWPPRSPIAQRLRPGHLLNVTGSHVLSSITTELRGNIEVWAGSHLNPLLAALAYGSKQSPESFLGEVITPARPWAVLRDEDVQGAVKTLADYYLGTVQ